MAVRDGSSAALKCVIASAPGAAYSRLSRMILPLKTAWATRNPEVFAPDPRLPELLDSMEAYAKEAGGLLRYRENGRRHEEVVRRMAVARSWKMGVASDRALIMADRLHLSEWRPGLYGHRADDPAAIGGRKIVVYSRNYGWMVKFFMRDLAFDRGVKYRVRVHVKAEKTGASGEAFAAGIYDAGQRPQNIAWRHFDVADMPDGYAWFDVGELRPTDRSMMWIATAKPTDAPPATTSIAVDAVEISRAE